MRRFKALLIYELPLVNQIVHSLLDGKERDYGLLKDEGLFKAEKAKNRVGGGVVSALFPAVPGQEPVLPDHRENIPFAYDMEQAQGYLS